MDKQLTRAIKIAAGHPPPVNADEVDSIRDMQVLRARDLGGIEEFTSLRNVLLNGCDPVSLAPMASMRQLEVLVVEYCGFASLEGFDLLPETLGFLKARCNMLTDLSPLLNGPRIARLEVQGNPLSEDSVDRVVPELRDRGVRVLLSEEPEWRLTLRMQAEGLPFSYYKADDGHRLCAPGLSFTDRPGSGHPRVAPDELERMLDAGETDEVRRLFERDDLKYYSGG